MISEFLRDALRDRVADAVQTVLDEHGVDGRNRVLVNDLVWSVCATVEQNFDLCHGDDYVDS